MLYVGLDQQYMDRQTFDELLALAMRASSATYGLIRFLSQNLDWKSKLSLLPFFVLFPLLRNL